MADSASYNGKFASAGAYEVSATYGYASSAYGQPAQLTATTTVNVYAIEDVAVTAPETTSYTVEDPSAIVSDPTKLDTTGVSVSAVYANGTKTKALEAGEWKVQSIVANVATADVDNDYVVYVTSTLDTSDSPATDNYIITLTAAEKAHGTPVSITSIALATDADDETITVYYGDDANDKSLYVVTGEDEEGNSFELAASEYNLYFGAGVTDETFSAVGSDAATVYVQLASDPSQVISDKIDVSDYIVGVRISNTGATAVITSYDDVERGIAPDTEGTDKYQVLMKSNEKTGTWTDVQSANEATTIYWERPVLDGTGANQTVNLYAHSGNPSVSDPAAQITFVFRAEEA